MKRPGGAEPDQQRGKAAALVENILIGASLPALWLWFLRQAGYRAFQGWWVNVVLVVVLVIMLVIAVRRLSGWASLGWHEDGAQDRRKNG